MKGKDLKELAEETRSRLRIRGRYGSSSDLYINKEKRIAVIGIQTSEGGFSHDTIYLLRKSGKIEAILDRDFESGRMFPTGISEDGKKLFYSVKDDYSGEFHKKKYDIR